MFSYKIKFPPSFFLSFLLSFLYYPSSDVRRLLVGVRLTSIAARSGFSNSSCEAVKAQWPDTLYLMADNVNVNVDDLADALNVRPTSLLETFERTHPHGAHPRPSNSRGPLALFTGLLGSRARTGSSYGPLLDRGKASPATMQSVYIRGSTPPPRHETVEEDDRASDLCSSGAGSNRGSSVNFFTRKHSSVSLDFGSTTRSKRGAPERPIARDSGLQKRVKFGDNEVKEVVVYDTPDDEGNTLVGVTLALPVFMWFTLLASVSCIALYFYYAAEASANSHFFGSTPVMPMAAVTAVVLLAPASVVAFFTTMELESIEYLRSRQGSLLVLLLCGSVVGLLIVVPTYCNHFVAAFAHTTEAPSLSPSTSKSSFAVRAYRTALALRVTRLSTMSAVVAPPLSLVSELILTGQKTMAVGFTDKIALCCAPLAALLLEISAGYARYNEATLVNNDEHQGLLSAIHLESTMEIATPLGVGVLAAIVVGCTRGLCRHVPVAHCVGLPAFGSLLVAGLAALLGGSTTKADWSLPTTDTLVAAGCCTVAVYGLCIVAPYLRPVHVATWFGFTAIVAESLRAGMTTLFKDQLLSDRLWPSTVFYLLGLVLVITGAVLTVASAKEHGMFLIHIQPQDEDDVVQVELPTHSQREGEET